MHCILYYVQCSLCTVHCALCTVHRSPFTVHRAPCTVHRAPCTVHRAPCTVHRAPCTVHRAPCTVHRAPCTVHSELRSRRQPAVTNRSAARTDWFTVCLSEAPITHKSCIGVNRLCKGIVTAYNECIRIIVRIV